MDLTHKLTYNGTTTIIDEPIGFDDFKMSFNRSKYHGISAEVSETNLEFYGEAINIIKSAYHTDIDSEITYEVYSYQTRIYSGKIDLSTYQERQAEYQSISVKVGEVGVKTTFNNRLDTEVDLNTPKTIDGDPVEAPDWLEMQIPLKHLYYTNKLNQDNDFRVNRAAGDMQPSDKIDMWNTLEYEENMNKICLPIGGDSTTINEFGTFGVVQPQVNSDADSIEVLYSPTQTHQQDYGNNTRVNVTIDLTVSFVDVETAQYGDFGTFPIALVIKGDTTISIQSVSRTFSGKHHFYLQGEFNAEQPIRYYIELQWNTYTDQNVKFHAIIREGSFIKMQMYDNLENDNKTTQMLFVHDTLNIISHCISENQLAVISDWYGIENTLGGGALKALTNGYHIRGLFSNADNERNMPLSFKKLIDSLNALDCIGWGFDTENGETCVRVERWDWFYKDNVVLTLANVAEVTIDIDPDRIISELQIGYKKYATTDQYNSIDSPHGTRTFVNGIKAVSKTETQECDFIADNYAIEETRRARQQKNETEESRYDENIFVFELIKKASNYEIGHTGLEAELVGNEREFINAKLTPRQMITRWKNYLFATQNSTPFKFTSGEINYKSSFFPMPQYSGNIISLQNFEDTGLKTTENDPITYLHAKYKAEKITFSYPLTIAQYEAVKANQYGLISVNGMLGWILDFKYSFADGMADFTLLAKY